MSKEIAFTPEIQSLRNISIIKSNAELRGLTDIVELIDRYNPVGTLNGEYGTSPIDRIDRLTACISHTWRLTPPSLRRAVFTGYIQPEGLNNTPKAEVETFCSVTEPEILSYIAAQ